MALEINDAHEISSPLYLKNWIVSKGQANGILHDQANNIDYSINYPLPLSQDLENYSSCKIFLFKNRFGSKEDHCFNVTINKDRSGVIFPIKVYSTIQNLISPTSSKESEFLYRFLHIAFYHLLNAQQTVSKSINNNALSNSILKIEEFYDEETIIFLYHDSTSKNLNIDIETCYPSFFKLGYVPIITESDFTEIEILNRPVTKHPLYSLTILDSINIYRTKSSIIKEKYVYQIFSSILKLHLTPISRFILIYQIIELLIDKIALEFYKQNKPFGLSTSVLMMKADSSTSYRDTYDNIKEIQKIIEKSTKNVRDEEARINKLFFDKCNLSIHDYNDFINSAKVLIGKKSCTTLTDYVYQLRNKIIHDYHNLSINHVNIEELLIDVNTEFEKFISDVIIDYP